MALDVVDAVFQVAIPLGQVDLQQIAQDVLQVGAEVRREPQSAADDLLVDLDRLVGEEGWIAGGHLIQQHAQRPPVDRLVVALAEDDLRREVLGRAAQRPRAPFHPLGKAEIGHLQVAFRIDEQIFRFKVAVDDLQVVQVLEGEHDLGGVEARMRLAEFSHFAQVREHLAAGHVLQHHIQVRVVFKMVFHTD